MAENIKVTVLIASYNHEKFIKDAIEGAINQKTDFNFEVMVFDDASTDGTPEIIHEYERKYPGFVKGIFSKENLFQNSKCGMLFLFPQLRGEYFALCDGDDYWTDNEKLQVQIDFLETHKEYSMCMHNAVKINYSTGEKQLLNTFPKDGTYSQEQQLLAGLGTNFPASASYVFRAELFKDIPDFFLASQVLDYPIRQYFASRGKVYYFEKPMSVYRVSTSHSYMQETRESKEFYNQYTLQMIRFFEQFNQYTDRKFDSILKRKILSDYFGFCVSIPEKEGMGKASVYGLETETIQKCYSCLNENYLDSRISLLQKQVANLFIYGTSRLAMVCQRQLEFAGIEFAGFVVSDGQEKMDMIGQKKVFYLSDVIGEYGNFGLILAVQPVNADSIIHMLKMYGIMNYCEPYMV